MLASVTLLLIMMRFFHAPFSLEFKKYYALYHFSRRIFLYQNTLHKYSEKDVKNSFEDNCVFNSVNARVRYA